MSEKHEEWTMQGNAFAQVRQRTHFLCIFYTNNTQHRRRRRCCRCCNETHNSWCNRFNLHLLYLIPWIGVCECFFSLCLFSTLLRWLFFFYFCCYVSARNFFLSPEFGSYGCLVFFWCAFIYTLLLVLWLLRLHRRHDDTNVLRRTCTRFECVLCSLSLSPSRSFFISC